MKLSDREIVELHRLAKDGSLLSELARRFGVHRNTVTAHVRLRVAYSDKVYRSIGANNNLPSTVRMSLYDASAYLPGFPSRDVVYRLYQEGVIRAKMTAPGPSGGRKSSSVRRRLTVTRSQVRSAAKKMMPDGLWIRTDSLPSFCESVAVADKINDAMRDSRQHCRFWPCKKYAYLPANVVRRVADELGASLSIPFQLRRRASLCLELCDVATI